MGGGARRGVSAARARRDVGQLARDRCLDDTAHARTRVCIFASISLSHSLENEWVDCNAASA